MKYKPLGRTGLFVSELCLGTITFAGGGQWSAMGSLDQQAANAIVKTALEGGINFIDTANVYSGGLAETVTGQALRDLGVARSDVVIATKALGPMGGGVNDRGASRYHLLTQIDASLERLGLDHVDLYQIHGWDPATPLEETLRALDDIVRSGRARYIGVSNWAAWQIVKALGISERRGWESFASLQAYYSVAGRDLETELVPMLESEGLGLMVWSPLAGGFLSGKYTRESEGEGRRANFDFPPIDKERAYDLVALMREIAGRHDASVPQVALSWLLSKPVVTSLIVGARKAEQLTDNLGATRFALFPDDIARLDGAMPAGSTYPGWMIERQAAYRSGAQAGAMPAR
ncbi:aldo/keto reductase [Novosphingobium sp. PC22D]|uniref:aldo/keto reductase n=1 Tax=Novosphingobium sp. PC22D TaxID=1962403 RepID=UPI000BF04E32|nr:aldo/keto reductase [Novosphingobium sp. PC22D]PEQ12093.1 aldo/keto reductase [Novosphingobium sp. PC22D]